MEEVFPEIDDFEFIRKLGQGSFGIVYHVRDKKSREELALKVFDQKKFKQSGIENEVKILSSLDHPNIVRFYKGQYTSQFYYIIMEYLQGETLESFLKERAASDCPLEDEESSQIIRQLLLAVQYLHNKMVIHRDITLGNIMLSRKGDPSLIKLIDFGLSGQGSMEQRTFSTQCGTPIFMAPEFYRYPNYSKMVDIWSCGIILYMACNKCMHPFYSKNLSHSEYFRSLQTLQENKTFSEGFNQDACNLFQKMTAFEPSDRYTVDQALNHPWVTRNFKENVPLTGAENIQAFTNSSHLTRIAKALFFLQFYKRIAHKFTKREADCTPSSQKNKKPEHCEGEEKKEKARRKFIISSISIPNRPSRSETLSPVLNKSPLISCKNGPPSCEKIVKQTNNAQFFHLKMNPVQSSTTETPLIYSREAKTKSNALIIPNFNENPLLESPLKRSSHRHIVASRASAIPFTTETDRSSPVNASDDNFENHNPMSQTHFSNFKNNNAGKLRESSRHSTLEPSKQGENSSKRIFEKSTTILPPIDNSPTRVKQQPQRGKSYSKCESWSRNSTVVATSESQSPSNKLNNRQDEDEIYIKRVLENFREKAVNKRFVNLKDVYQILEKVEDKMAQQSKNGGKASYRAPTNPSNTLASPAEESPETHGKDFRIRKTASRNNNKTLAAKSSVKPSE